MPSDVEIMAYATNRDVFLAIRHAVPQALFRDFLHYFSARKTFSLPCNHQADLLALLSLWAVRRESPGARRAMFRKACHLVIFWLRLGAA
jgi:hypothetical protein